MHTIVECSGVEVFLLVQPEKLLQTVRLETEEDNTLFASFVISANVCRLSVLKQRKIFLSPLSSVFRGRLLQGIFLMKFSKNLTYALLTYFDNVSKFMLTKSIST